MKGVSILVCCYNSASRLPQTLRHIALQRVDEGVPWEVIVINNASTDNTKQAAADLWKQLHCPVAFSVIDEPVPGLSAARNRGLAASQYDYLLFCDDDNWLQDDYVQLSFSIMQSDGQIGALGGQFEAVFDADPPGWFNHFAPNYTIGRQAPERGDITFTKSYVSGAGAVYRKAVLQYLAENGFKSLLTDRKGNALSTGGDVELGYAIRMAKYKIWYDDRLKLKHFIPKERLTCDYVERLFQGYLESVPVHLAYEQNFFPRQGFKKSWQWLLLMRMAIIIKRQFLPRREKTGEPWIEKLRFRYEMDMMRSLLYNRHAYEENVNKLKHSNWNKTRNATQ